MPLRRARPSRLGPRPRLHLPLLIEGQAESLRLIESVERPDGSRRRGGMLLAFPDDDYEHVNALRFWMLTVTDPTGIILEITLGLILTITLRIIPRNHSEDHSRCTKADLLSIMKSYDRRHDYRPT